MVKPSEYFFPAGPAGVLLIHGLTGTPNEMRSLARGLQRAGYTVYGLQLAGHCGAAADLLSTGWHDWYESVARGAEKLRAETDHLFVGGLSMGAVLSLRYAIEHPDKVCGLGLYGTTFFYDGWAIPPIARLSFMLPWVDALGFGRKQSFIECFPYGIKNERIRRFISSAMLAGDSVAAGLSGNPWPSLAEFYRLSAWVRWRLDQVSTPCLVMHARNDDIASLRNAQLIENRVSGPVETVVLEDSYHMITVDQQKDLVISHSADFFARHRLPARSRTSARLSGSSN